MSPSKQIVIVGCGRLGGALANTLSLEGHRVVVIDQKESSFDKLTAGFSGFKIVGDAVELHILKQARLSEADYLFATTTSDNTNLMVAQVAKIVFNVPKVVARVFNPGREAMYKNFGVETINPTQLSAIAFLQTMSRQD